MKTKDFIARLQQFRPDMEIVIECPNGLITEPTIKFKHEISSDIFSDITAYVISWRE